MGLIHNDPWVESRMWPQQTGGQRSSRGQWPLVHGLGHNDPWVDCTYHLNRYGSNLILQRLQKYVIAKAGETRGSRTALFQHDCIDLLSELKQKKNKTHMHIKTYPWTRVRTFNIYKYTCVSLNTWPACIQVNTCKHIPKHLQTHLRNLNTCEHTQISLNIHKCVCILLNTCERRVPSPPVYLCTVFE